MRKLTAAGIVVIAVGLLACLTIAQPPGGRGVGRQGRGPRPGGGDFGPPRFPVMTALDANQDGEISAAEVENAAAALKKLDRNSDGKLSQEELRPQFAGRGGPGGPGGPGGRGRMGPPEGGQTSSLQSSPRPKDDAEEKILNALNEIRREQGRMMNVPEEDGRLLRLLSETIGAKTVVEVGTSNGVSGIWLALALRRTGGKLITHEISADRAALARENFAAAGVADLVTVVEGDAHETVSKLTGPIDLVFIDADKEGYLDYLEKLLPVLRPGGLVLAHNMNPRMADRRFVEAITTNPDLETVFYLQGGGVSITLKKR